MTDASEKPKRAYLGANDGDGGTWWPFDSVHARHGEYVPVEQLDDLKAELQVALGQRDRARAALAKAEGRG